MIEKFFDRRKFVKSSLIAGAGLTFGGKLSPLLAQPTPAQGKRVGIIGLDTSHSIEFTKTFNVEGASTEYGGYKVVAAYPQGSLDIQSSASRIPGYVEKVKGMGVEIVDSIDNLLKKVDVVLLETNDGRRHLEQAIPVLRAKKRMFIDKPMAASLADAMTIFQLAKQYDTPLFSSSTLRFITTAQDVRIGKIGKVLGADAYSPCALEKTHPDFFWYGIHGVELLYTVMGEGCQEVTRTHTDSTDVAVGRWDDGRIGTFRGMRDGKHLYGGTAYGENGDATLGPIEGYEPLLKKIVHFFDTGTVPVKEQETLEMLAFMEAADESKKRNGASVLLKEIWKKADDEAKSRLKKLRS